MKQPIVTQIGQITDSQNYTLLKMWEVNVPKGKRPLTKHQHLNFEIMLVNSGTGTYTIENHSYPISSGDMFVFSSNECHCITNVGENGLHITNLQFDPQFIQHLQSGFADISSMLTTNICLQHNAAFQNRIRKENTAILKSLFLSIREELEAHLQEYIYSSKSLLLLFFINLIRYYNYVDFSKSISTEQLSTIQNALSYIDMHFAEKITLQEVSLLAGLTPNYFCALFKQVSGMTLSDYISAKRIDKAIHLLTNETAINIIDIATACGYNSTANFNKAFKRITGTTPREYRANTHTMIS